MNNDRLFYKLKTKMNEVASIPVQETGPFDLLWKKAIPFFKQTPIRVYMISAVIGSCALYLLLGNYLVKIVSLLQKGF